MKSIAVVPRLDRGIHELKQSIVDACRILVMLQLDSGPFGNVSVRVPNTDQYWVNPNGLTFNQFTSDDMVLMNIQGSRLSGQHDPHPGEFIHREIYRLRPDVNAIVHTHSHHTVMVSLLETTIEPYTQLGAAIYGDQGLYLGFTGPVRSSDEGLAIAQALENKAIVIAKNHGLFTTGTTLQSALWDMVVCDWAAKVHLDAKQLGLKSAEILSPDYLEKSRLEVRNKQSEFMWNAYLHALPQHSFDIPIVAA